MAYWLMGRTWSLAQWVTAVTYTVNFYIPAVGSLSHPINHAWSLAIEEQFYLLWPYCILLLLARRGIGRLPVSRTVVWASAIAIFFVLIGRIVAVGLHASWFTVTYSFWGRADALAIGCLLAGLLRLPAGQKIATAISVNPWLPALTAGTILIQRIAATPIYLMSVGFTIEALLIAVFLIQLILQHRSRLWSWLDHPVSKYLGVLSYSIYLWHSWALAFAERVFVNPVGRTLAGLVMTLVLAMGSYYVIERPFLRLKKRYG
jgi:peptidoglycan/LPS O-acetylase OafA/YrhL